MNSEGILSHKQHLNLSHFAYDIVESDMHFFQKESLSSFINLIFRNYYESAEASIHRALERKRAQIIEQLYQVVDSEKQEEIVQAFVKQEEARILENMQSYPKGYGFKFYLNTENVDLLTEEFSLVSAWYEGHPMKYYRTVIEEYARKNRLEREKIVFSNIIDELHRCIDQKLLLCVDTSDYHFEVKPYTILADQDSLYNYLVGISRPVGTDPSEDKIASFRISSIKRIKIRPKTYRSGRITSQEEEEILEKIKNQGVQFLISQSDQMIVRLTKRGLERFRKQPHLRPKLIQLEEQDDGAICYFNCTEFQIRSYFFQFGPDVEILEPESLRNHFKTYLSKAANLYN